MPKLTLLAATLSLLSLPTLASAQSMGAELDSPVTPPPGTTAAGRATPEPAEVDADVIPEPPRHLSTPYATQVDPEIVALRNGTHGTHATAPAETGYLARRRAQIAHYQLQMAERRSAEPRLGFGASNALGWAGLGLGAGAGALLGVVGGAIACETENHFGCSGDLSIGAAFGAASIAPLGSAIGVWLHGDARGAGGNFFAALAGSYVGAGIGAGIMAALITEGGILGILTSPIGAAIGMVLSTIGAAAGYHLTSGSSEPSTEHAGVQAMPTLAPTDDGQGATVGAVGLF